MSLSCHKAIFSKAGITLDLINRARPVRFSLKIGFFLCGIAEDPFWDLPKYSSTSKTSVLWRCLISIANLSIELAIIPSVEKNWACLSLGIIWVDTGSTLRLSFFATNFSTLGSILANVPTAPEIAHVEISSIESFNLFLFLTNSW